MNTPEEITETEQDLYEHYRITADLGQQPLRVDRFLTNLMPNISRNRIQNAAKAGSILVNDQPVKPNHKVKAEDVVSLVLSYPKTEFELTPEKMPLDIRHEDDQVLVLHKPAGLVVHPGHGNFSGTLVNGLLHYLKEIPGSQQRPGLVHRLDKNTSGLMVIAKDEVSMTHLARQFFDRTIDRKYLALVWGEPSGEGTVTGHIGRSPKNRTVMAVFPDGDQGKHAVTHYSIVEKLGYVTMMECQLDTGRTHQIRAHMKYIGHPLFGDVEYGGDKILKGTTFTKYKQFVQNCLKLLPRQALHARSLAFNHPKTGQRMAFEAPLPDDMQQVVEKWRSYALHKKE